jgi:CRP/FNR family transcriptional regulator, nitrogen oxide reductase regulator
LVPDLLSQKAIAVKQLPLFSGVSVSDCANIVSSAREKNFARRQTIFAEGDPVRQISLLISGCVKLTQIGEDGSEVILRLAGPGEIVGALGLCTDVGHCSTAQTMESSTVLVWGRANFESLLERFPVLHRNVIRVLESRLQDMDLRFREVSTQKVAPRLSSELVRLLSQVGKRVNGSVEISLSRAELAQLTGTTLFTVSRLLSQWNVRGIVYARRESVTVRDLPALMELSQGEPELTSLRTRVSA